MNEYKNDFFLGKWPSPSSTPHLSRRLRCLAPLTEIVNMPLPAIFRVTVCTLQSRRCRSTTSHMTITWPLSCNLTLCLKKECHFYFCNNFGKYRPILMILSLLYSHIYTAEEGFIKTTTSPQVCCRTTLRNLNAQLYNFTRKLLNSIRHINV